jgi:membrane protein DedA with SNARE-associated domain
MIVKLRRTSLAVLLIVGAVLAVQFSMAQTADAAGAQSGQDSSPDIEQQHSARVRHFRESLAQVRPLLERYGYAAAAAATLAEGIGIPTPGQTLLIALEVVEGRMNIWLLLLLVAMAAIIGNSAGYVLGRWGGRFVLRKLHVDPQRQQYLDELFRRRGGMVVLFGRFVDGLRQLNGIVAGIMKMPWWIFTAYNVAGAVLWTGAWGLGTYYFGRRIHIAAGFLHHHRRLLIALSAALFGTLLAYLFCSNMRAKARQSS